MAVIHAVSSNRTAEAHHRASAVSPSSSPKQPMVDFQTSLTAQVRSGVIHIESAPDEPTEYEPS
jgi:hypothetical protein